MIVNGMRSQAKIDVDFLAIFMKTSERLLQKRAVNAVVARFLVKILRTGTMPMVKNMIVSGIQSLDDVKSSEINLKILATRLMKPVANAELGSMNYDVEDCVRFFITLLISRTD